MNLKSVADYLANLEYGLEGKTLFVNEMPSSCLGGILLLDSYYGTATDPYLPDFYRGEFRLVVRSADYSTGSALIRRTVKQLNTMTGQVGDLAVYRAFALNLPRDYRRSVGGYWEFEVDMNIVFIDTST